MVTPAARYSNGPAAPPWPLIGNAHVGRPHDTASTSACAAGTHVSNGSLDNLGVLMPRRLCQCAQRAPCVPDGLFRLRHPVVEVAVVELPAIDRVSGAAGSGSTTLSAGSSGWASRGRPRPRVGSDR